MEIAHAGTSGTIVAHPTPQGKALFLPPVATEVWKPNEWNQWEITCRGKSITVSINGQVMQSVAAAGDARLKYYGDEGPTYLEAGPGRARIAHRV